MNLETKCSSLPLFSRKHVSFNRDLANALRLALSLWDICKIHRTSLFFPGFSFYHSRLNRLWISDALHSALSELAATDRLSGSILDNANSSLPLTLTLFFLCFFLSGDRPLRCGGACAHVGLVASEPQTAGASLRWPTRENDTVNALPTFYLYVFVYLVGSKCS